MVIPTTENNKRYYWLKLKDDFFRQKEIKQLRKIAGGDVFIIIYLKMLLRSLRDDGKLYYEGIEENFPAELALDIDEDVENVKITVAYLQSKGILVQSDIDEYQLLTAGEMTGSEGYSAERVRRFRSKQQLALQCNTDVTGCNEEKREKREEKEKDREYISSIDDDFSKFWDAYPRKDGKQEAIKAWKSLKPNADLQRVILDDIRRRMDRGGAWYKTEKRFIKLPASYLRGRRWEDEGGVTEVAERREPDAVQLTAEEERIIDEIYANGGGWG